MDVTHITFFAQQPYLHVVIDTYSKFIWVVPQHHENIRAISLSFTMLYSYGNALKN
jgi:hypothetical protein